jgi:hypothetical protein
MSLARLLPTRAWQRVREEAWEKAGHRCEVCGSAGNLYGDEDWQYDDGKRVARLLRVRSICETCHRVVHWGRSGKVLSPDDFERVVRHALAVNHCTRAAWQRQVKEAYKVWERRSGRKWAIDWGQYAHLVPSVLPEED